MPPLLYPFRPPSGRVRVLPDEPDAMVAPRPRGSRRPHSDTKVASVRRLIEETTLTYGEIATRTGVGRASICRWTRDGQWKRPPFAPPATDTIPRPRASQKLKLRLLAERLRALAERCVRELEETPSVDPEKLMQALEVLKMARLEAMGRRRRRRMAIIEHAMSARTRDEITRRALNEMRNRGVDVERAPTSGIPDVGLSHSQNGPLKEALDLLIEARTPVEDHPALHPRGWRKR